MCVEQDDITRARHDANDCGRTGQRGAGWIDVLLRKVLTPRDEGETALFWAEILEVEVDLGEESRRMRRIYAYHVGDVWFSAMSSPTTARNRGNSEGRSTNSMNTGSASRMAGKST